MTNTQRLTIKASEQRQRLNEIAGLDSESLTDEVRAEGDKLTVEYRDTESQLRAAVAAEGDPAETRTAAGETSEDRAKIELRNKANVGAFVGACLRNEQLSGAEAEYASAMGCPGLMPLDMLRPSGVEARQREEHRAVTPGQNVPAGTQSPIPYVFQETVSARLGVSMPMVPAGVKHYPVLGTAPPAGPKAKDAAADSTAAAFTLANRTAKRITGQFIVRREDLAVMPDMAESLQGAMGDSMANAFDDQILAGNGTAPNLTGLLKLATDVSAAGAVETFATGVARFAEIVDGRYANGWGDLRACIGVDTFAKYAGLFQSNGDMSLFDYLMGKLGALIVSKRVPALSGNAQKGLVVRTRGSQIMEVPIWNGVSFIRDEFTKAAEGQVIVTAILLAGDPHLPYTTNTVVEVHPKLS